VVSRVAAKGGLASPVVVPYTSCKQRIGLTIGSPCFETFQFPILAETVASFPFTMFLYPSLVSDKTPTGEVQIHTSLCEHFGPSYGIVSIHTGSGTLPHTYYLIYEELMICKIPSVPVGNERTIYKRRTVKGGSNC
jgi:hypothetical protein